MEVRAMKPAAIIAGGFAGGVLVMLLLERWLARAQRVVPALPADCAAASLGSQEDAELRDRVSSRLGDWVSHPGAIEVDVANAVVRVSGQVLAKELDGLLFQITGVPGVRKVHNALDVLSDPSGFGEVPQGKSRTVSY